MALEHLGFTRIYVDVQSARAAEDWSAGIFKAVTECDLFIAVVGMRWAELLTTRAPAAGADVLVHEIALAHEFDRFTCLVRVDDGPLPSMAGLGPALRSLMRKQAVHVASTAEAVAWGEVLTPVVQAVRPLAAEVRGVTSVLITASILIYLMVAIPAHVAGIVDFGWEAWSYLAVMWAGMFVWPIFFLPFALAGLYRPCFTILRDALRFSDGGARRAAAATFGVPVLLASGLTYFDASNNATAWTIRPNQLCGSRAGADAALFTIDADARLAGILATRGETPRWITDRRQCWPSAYLYLTMPLVTGVSDQTYLRDREPVRRTFDRIVHQQEWRSLDYRDSAVFWPYVALVWFISYVISLLLAVIVHTVGYRLKDPQNPHLSRSRDALNASLSLTFGLACQMSWVCYRAPTHFYKAITYTHYDASVFASDVLLALLLTAALAAIAATLAFQFRRWLQAALGVGISVGFVTAGLAVGLNLPQFGRLGVSALIVFTLLCWGLMLALWPVFAPDAVRSRDFVRRFRDLV